MTNGVYTTGNQTIGGTKTFSSTISGSITGNAGTATTLQTARTINGTSFNGSANITTSSWGTARNVSISDADATNTGTAVSVDGSGAVTLKLPSTIKASLSGNASTVTNGVYTTGNQTIGGTKTFSSTISGNITGNAGTVTNGVYTTGSQTITGDKTFSGTTTAVTQAASDNSTKIATTAYVQSRVCTTPATTTSTASANTPAYIVENYRNSSTGDWYRIWSDGWIEQGYNGSSSTTVTTYEFLKPFSDDGYTLVFGAATINQYWTNKTASGFKFNSNGSGARSWYACGY